MKEEIKNLINEEMDKINPSLESIYEDMGKDIEKKVQAQNELIKNKVVELEEKDFKEIIKKGSVLVDCYATWCGPCKMLSPIIDKIAEENKKYNFYKLDIDNAEEVVKEYGIMSIPTLLIFQDGELKEKVIGLHSKSEIEELLK